mmetsp:Transcript_35618/g.79178  ORF Transcript_35618/g.79178 Transcript_35618/m.79178 type:complete len:158 (-) Transcript_35618:1033-1506(-)|eukprot:CAMPEP_0202891830 /NCGR_PEP_ID=MMETSP1392-20130828/1783_1 /ASSEMBLY_ACC=CAM_ASM_000868 /TAXON_ID=225041 /ORGANISM="Chlamydomonas chlamydogama, Strain SAG 11-48b" /LENGTH=157 /DNA_ID=CAMNT_0049575691 /DNA_START=133 /DNA_END=606 /DNA_ORIENTATION=+
MPQELPITFDIVREKNLEALKLLNGVIFPIKYQDQLYKDCMACEDITQLAYHNDVLVGAIAARCERQASGKARMYIATLGVLAPYRGYGIGTRLLERSLEAAQQDSNIEEVYLHVQVGNDEAVEFYKKHNFEVRETVKDYYKKLSPPDAVILAKKLA